mmetsp:Transcript_1063/g.3538  ORF Transcript_1063/g.3538 Transcript_1063/m.3538 type:complete len:90 (+) Transcript_1063:344-613(+)
MLSNNDPIDLDGQREILAQARRAAYSRACLLTKRRPLYVHATGVGSVALSLMNCLGKPSAPPPVIVMRPSTTIGSWLSTLSIGEGTPAS